MSSKRPFKRGDIVTWSDDPDAQDCRERYAPGPYLVSHMYSDTAITITHLDGKSVRYRSSRGVHMDNLHCGLEETKFRLDVFLDAAKKAQTPNG